MKTPRRVGIVHAFFVLFALALIARAAEVQVVEGKSWAARAKRQHFFASALSAPRGEILDASGNTLVESREMTRVAVALPEVRDTAFVLKTLHHAQVDVSIRELARQFDGGLAEEIHQPEPEGGLEGCRNPLCRLLSGFGLLAVTLAVVGIYGVISHSVSQRAREIGIRMALGATPWKVLREVLGEGAALVGAGLAAGLGCALLVMHLLTGRRVPPVV